MAKTKTAGATIGLVLCDAPGHGLKAGQVVSGSAELIATLVADGSADDAEAAVAHAIGEGAATVDLTPAA